MDLEQSVEKLRTLGLFPNTLRNSAEIFRDSSTTDTVIEEVGRRSYSCGGEQFIYYHLRAIMEKDQEFRIKFLGEAVQRLGNLGIKPAHIEEYFQIGASPGLDFILEHGQEYEHSTILSFYQRADQFALDKVRQWLGIQENS